MDFVILFWLAPLMIAGFGLLVGLILKQLIS